MLLTNECSLSENVKHAAASLKREVVNLVPDSSEQLESVELKCSQILAHLGEAKENHVWQQKLDIAEHAIYEHELTIEELQRQLTHNSETTYCQWTEMQDLHETVMYYEGEIEHVPYMQQALDELTKEVADRKTQLEAKSVAYEEQQEELAALRRELVSQSTSADALKAQLLDAQEKHKKDSQTVRTEVETLAEKVREAERHAAERDADCKRKDEQIAQLDNELAAKEGWLEATRDQLITSRRDFEQHNQALHEQHAQRLLDAVQLSAEESSTESAKLVKRLKAANLANEKHEQELSSRARALQQLQAKVRDDEITHEEAAQQTAKQAQEKQAALDQTSAKLSKAAAERDGLQEQLRLALKKNEKLTSDLSEANTASAAIRAQAEQLQAEVCTLGVEKEELLKNQQLEKTSIEQLQQALIDTQRTAKADLEARGTAAIDEITAAVQLVDTSLQAFANSQADRGKLQASLEEFSGGLVSSAKLSPIVNRLKNDRSTTSELREHLKKTLSVHEKLMRSWKAHEGTVFAISSAANVPALQSQVLVDQQVDITSTAANLDRERRVSIKSPAILDGVETPISVEQERMTRRGIVMPRSIMKTQSQSSATLVVNSQAGSASQNDDLEIPDSQIVVSTVPPRVIHRRPIAHTMYNRQVSSTSTKEDTQPLEPQGSQSSAKTKTQSQTLPRELTSTQGTSSSRTIPSSRRKTESEIDEQARKRPRLSRSMSQYFPQSSATQPEPAVASSRPKPERRGGPMQRKPSNIITYSQQTALQA